MKPVRSLVWLTRPGMLQSPRSCFTYRDYQGPSWRISTLAGLDFFSNYV